MATAQTDPTHTNRAGYRVAFDANGQRARFYRTRFRATSKRGKSEALLMTQP